jgi:nucleoside-diphosphate kinase
MEEKTLVLVKPDGVKRGIAGKIISRFEETGLKIIAVKMTRVSEEHAEKHYALDDEWARNVFEKARASAEKENRKMKYQSHLEMGKDIQRKNVNFLVEGPVIALVLRGNHAIEIVRKMIGNTEPRNALPGTIRADFISTESYSLADSENRVIRNLVHASDSPKSAEREIELWFKKEEINE